MGAKVGMLIPEQVVYITLEGNLSVAEYRRTFEQVKKIADGCSAERVHGVIDVTGLDRLPPIGALVNIPTSDKADWTLLVGVQSPLVSFAATVVHHTLGLRVKTVPSLDEALETLQTMDTTITVAPSDVAIQWLHTISPS